MARKTKTNLTFQVTLRDLEGVKIPDVRNFIRNALIDAERATDGCPNLHLDKLTIHLTNKETSYA